MKLLRVHIHLLHNRCTKQPIDPEPDKTIEVEVPDGLTPELLGLLAAGLVFRDGWAQDEVKISWDLV